MLSLLEPLGAPVKASDCFDRDDLVILVAVTYTLVDRNGQPGIRCHACGLTSFNPGDIEERYCAHCKHFHSCTIEAALAFQSITLDQLRELGAVMRRRISGK